MGDRLRAEQARLIGEVTRLADAARRSWKLTANLAFSNLVFALAPLVPRSEHILGALTTPVAMAIIAPGMLAMGASVYLYRRNGPETPAYRLMEILESTLQYCVALTFVYISGIRWSVVWALCPFTALFWALTKPFHVRVYSSIIVVTHLGLAVAFALRGTPGDSLISIGVGVMTWLAFAVVARSRRNDVFAEADRNAVRAELNESLLEGERERIARSLAQGVAQRLATLVGQLHSPQLPLEARNTAAVQAETALRELTSIVSASPVASLPRSVAELARLIEEKVRPLCVNAQYQQLLSGDQESTVAPATALATLRIVQELVRNAITHGAAKSIAVKLTHDGREVSLSVTDDGPGLQVDRLTSATGGLQNAQRWVAERGGSLHLVPSAAARGGTELRITMPAG